MTRAAISPRLANLRESRRRGRGLFVAACASLPEARAILPLVPDLLAFHPVFTERSAEGDSGMLTGLTYAGNANDAALGAAGALIPACAPCPVAVGLCGTDPFLRRANALQDWQEAGVEGLCNFPTVGLVDGLFRADLEAEGMGFAREAECLAQARRLGFLTMGLACRPEDAAALCAAPCDLLVLHLGLDAAAFPRDLTASAGLLPPYLYAIRRIEAQAPLLLLHGDSVSTPADEAALRELMAQGGPWDGVFAAGGAARILALHALCPWAGTPAGDVQIPGKWRGSVDG